MPVAQAIAPFAGLSESNLMQAVMSAALITASKPIPEEDLSIISEWAAGIQFAATALQLLLTGATEISVRDGKVAFRVPPAAVLGGDNGPKRLHGGDSGLACGGA